MTREYVDAAHAEAIADAGWDCGSPDDHRDRVLALTAARMAERGETEAAGVYLRAYQSVRRAQAIELAALSPAGPQTCRGCGYTDREFAVVGPCVPGYHTLGLAVT